MAKGQGQRVNRAQLAAFVGASLPTVDAWVRQGCPHEKSGVGRGSEYGFWTGEVLRWLQQRAADDASGTERVDRDGLRLRRDRAETRIAELELAQKMAEVAPLADMERTWARVLAECNGNLRGPFVTRVVSQLLGETNERRFKSVLLSELDASLECLATMEVASDDSGDE